MSATLSGVPGAQTSITPLGTIPGPSTQGIICVQGETERGEIAKESIVGTWSEFKQKFGGLLADSDFPLMCKQGLDSGSKLRVLRAFHYDDPGDASTVEGDAATDSLANSAVASVQATAIATIATWVGLTSNLTIKAPDLADPSATVTLANYNGTAAQTPTQAATAVAAAINGGTGVHKYSATSVGPLLTVKAPSNLGALANAMVITFTPTNGTLTSVSATFAGGVYVGGAYISGVLATWTGTGSNFTVNSIDLADSSLMVELVNYNGLGAESRSAALIAIAALVNGGTGSHGYVMYLLPSYKFVIAKSGASGAGGNGTMADVSITLGTITSASYKYANGVTAYGALTSTWTAKAVGAGYNGAVIAITASTNGKADYVDIKITLPNSDLPQEIKGLKRAQTADSIISLNKQMEGVSVSGLASYVLPIGTATLAGGTQDLSLIDDADYTGDSSAKTGWYGFDEVVDSMRIFNIARRTHGAGLGLQTYLEARKDMRGRTYVPLGLTMTGIHDFRAGEGAYAHVPLDSMYIDSWVGEVNITDPNNTEVLDYPINGGGYQLGNRSIADIKAGPWISDSGNDFGKIKGPNGTRLNLGSPGNAVSYGSLYDQYGVNAIINDPALKIVNWGNRTSLLDTTSLLSKANIADLCVYISREVKAIARLMSFKPNDIIMFNELYRRVLPFIKDTLVAGRAIEGDTTPGRGEGVWWHWLGDQFAKDLNDLKVNKKSEVDGGKYRVRFAFKPIAANEYIAIDIAPADSVTILSVAQLTSL